MTLNPCPFCGGKASIIEVEEPSNLGGYVVQCADCEASTRVWFPIKDDVTRILTEAWNRRWASPKNDAVRAFVRTVRERATRLQRLYRSARAEAIHEALETSASEVGE